jgi:hypothetical protein
VWIRQFARREEGIRVVDAVVDDPDLHAVAARTGERVQLVGADHAGARVGEQVVRRARVDLPHEREPREGRQLRDRKRHGHAVEHDLEATADPRLRDRAHELRRGRALRGGDAGEVAAGRRGRHVEPACRAGGGERSAVRGSERRQGQADDHAHAAVGVVWRDEQRAAPHARAVVFNGEERRACGARCQERRSDCEETHRTAQGREFMLAHHGSVRGQARPGSRRRE